MVPLLSDHFHFGQPELIRKNACLPTRFAGSHRSEREREGPQGCQDQVHISLSLSVQTSGSWSNLSGNAEQFKINAFNFRRHRGGNDDEFVLNHNQV